MRYRSIDRWKKIEAQGRADFLSAGKAYWLATIKKVKELRPKARIGYYGIPGQKDHSNFVPRYYEENWAHWQNMSEVLDAIDVFMPSIYLKSPQELPSWRMSHADFVRDTLTLVQDLSDAHGGKAIVPFVEPKPAPGAIPESVAETGVVVIERPLASV